MSTDQLADYLGHMKQAASNARGFIRDLDKESFLSDVRTQQLSS